MWLTADLNKAACMKLGKCQIKFLLSIHHDGTATGYGFVQGSARSQYKRNPGIPGPTQDRLSISEEAEGIGLQICIFDKHLPVCNRSEAGMTLLNRTVPGCSRLKTHMKQQGLCGIVVHPSCTMHTIRASPCHASSTAPSSRRQ